MFYTEIAVLLAGGMSVWEKVSTWYQGSFLHGFFTMLREDVFSVRFGAYENFSLGADAGSRAVTILTALFFGIVIAAALTAYTRVSIGGFVRKLLREECLSPEKAKTLFELGYFRSVAIRRELASGVTLRRLVLAADSADASAEKPSAKPSPKRAGKVDFLAARFYIPEDLRYRAEVRFEKEGSEWRSFFLTVALATVLLAVLCWALPDLFSVADHLISLIPN